MKTVYIIPLIRYGRLSDVPTQLIMGIPHYHVAYESDYGTTVGIWLTRDEFVISQLENVS